MMDKISKNRMPYFEENIDNFRNPAVWDRSNIINPQYWLYKYRYIKIRATNQEADKRTTSETF